MSCRERLRVALLAGTLGPGGAEKQLVYMARALAEAGVSVRVYCLTAGERYEQELCRRGLRPICVGGVGHPVLRLGALLRRLGGFRPHVVQSAHFFTNLYVAVAGRLLGCLALGAIRSDVDHEMQGNRFWGPWLLRCPTALITNSAAAFRNAQRRGVPPSALNVLENVIDLEEFDEEFDRQVFAADAAPSIGRAAERGCAGPVAAIVGRLVPAKRVDRFLTAVSIAQQALPELQGLVVGDGNQRAALEQLARTLPLRPGSIQFAGHCPQTAPWLRQAHMLVVSSDHEGFPNVVLEGMAARVPVITTPAGDAPVVVQDGVTGFVVPFDDVRAMAQRMVQLACAPALAREMGAAGRQIVEQRYGINGLAGRLLAIYRRHAEMSANRQVLQALRHQETCPAG